MLQQLSQPPASRVGEVQQYLDGLLQSKKNTPRSFAGIWSDIADDDFQESIDDMKASRELINEKFDEVLI